MTYLGVLTVLTVGVIIGWFGRSAAFWVDWRYVTPLQRKYRERLVRRAQEQEERRARLHEEIGVE